MVQSSGNTSWCPRTITSNPTSRAHPRRCGCWWSAVLRLAVAVTREPPTSGVPLRGSCGRCGHGRGGHATRSEPCEGCPHRPRSAKLKPAKQMQTADCVVGQFDCGDQGRWFRSRYSVRSRYSARSAPLPSPSGVYARSIHSEIQVTTSLRCWPARHTASSEPVAPGGKSSC